MILKADKLKQHTAQKPCKIDRKDRPSVRCHFDNGQEFLSKDGKKLFSWGFAGDFRLPIVPYLVACFALLTSLITLMISSKRK